MDQSSWLLLVINLPGKSGTPRMRLWRALKGIGAGTLRDGAYLLPASKKAEEVFAAQIANVEAAGGTAYRLEYSSADEQQQATFVSLFDRTKDYDEWLGRVSELAASLRQMTEAEARRKEIQLRRDFESIGKIDYFAGEENAQAAEAMKALSTEVNRVFSADEPSPQVGSIRQRSVDTFTGKIWATRKNLWVDRVASAWLIRRFIDQKASFMWLDRPEDCPKESVGFDFDGASFSHLDDLVTFEVLVHTFKLANDTALLRIAALVHYLDVGGIPAADGAGFVTLLSGVKQQHADDDQFLAAATPLFDHLYAAYSDAK